MYQQTMLRILSNGSFSNIETNSAEIMKKAFFLPLDSEWTSNVKMHVRTKTNTGKVRPESYIIESALCDAKTPLTGL